MENSDFGTIIKELMAIFAPSTDKNEESRANSNGETAEKEGQVAAKNAQSERRTGQSYAPSVPSGEKREGEPHPFAMLKTPAERYNDFLLRHEQFRREATFSQTKEAAFSQKGKDQAPSLKRQSAPQKQSRSSTQGQNQTAKKKNAKQTETNASSPSLSEASTYFSLPLFPEGQP